eukprot:m.123079 g.123079  ORF g.123079 m.123079 type:complete len:114 (+) comp14443_c2_seq3:316-657(+)
MYHRRQQKENWSNFAPGSLVRVFYYENREKKYKRGITGIVISKVNRGLGSSFTIRNVIEEVAFEMTFQLYHPLLVNVEVVEHNRRRRAKLYYLRHKNDNVSTVVLYWRICDVI